MKYLTCEVLNQSGINYNRVVDTVASVYSKICKIYSLMKDKPGQKIQKPCKIILRHVFPSA